MDPMSGRMITMSSQTYFGRFRQRTSSVEITSRMQKTQRTNRATATTPSPKITARTSLAESDPPTIPRTCAQEKGPEGPQKFLSPALSDGAGVAVASFATWEISAPRNSRPTCTLMGGSPDQLQGCLRRSWPRYAAALCAQ